MVVTIWSNHIHFNSPVFTPFVPEMSTNFTSYTDQNICIQQHHVWAAKFEVSSYQILCCFCFETWILQSWDFLFLSNIFCIPNVEPVVMYIFSSCKSAGFYSWQLDVCKKVKNLIMLLVWVSRFLQTTVKDVFLWVVMLHCWVSCSWAFKGTCNLRVHTCHVLGNFRMHLSVYAALHPRRRDPPLSLLFSCKLLIVVVGLKIASITNLFMEVYYWIFLLYLVHWSNICHQGLCKDSPLDQHIQNSVTLVATHHYKTLLS